MGELGEGEPFQAGHLGQRPGVADGDPELVDARAERDLPDPPRGHPVVAGAGADLQGPGAGEDVEAAVGFGRAVEGQGSAARPVRDDRQQPARRDQAVLGGDRIGTRAEHDLLDVEQIAGAERQPGRISRPAQPDLVMSRAAVDAVAEAEGVAEAEAVIAFAAEAEIVSPRAEIDDVVAAPGVDRFAAEGAEIEIVAGRRSAVRMKGPRERLAGEGEAAIGEGGDVEPVLRAGFVEVPDFHRRAGRHAILVEQAKMKAEGPNVLGHPAEYFLGVVFPPADDEPALGEALDDRQAFEQRPARRRRQEFASHLLPVDVEPLTVNVVAMGPDDHEAAVGKRRNVGLRGGNEARGAADACDEEFPCHRRAGGVVQPGLHLVLGGADLFGPGDEEVARGQLSDGRAVLLPGGNGVDREFRSRRRASGIVDPGDHVALRAADRRRDDEAAGSEPGDGLVAGEGVVADRHVEFGTDRRAVGREHPSRAASGPRELLVDDDEAAAGEARDLDMLLSRGGVGDGEAAADRRAVGAVALAEDAGQAARQLAPGDHIGAVGEAGDPEFPSREAAGAVGNDRLRLTTIDLLRHEVLAFPPRANKAGGSGSWPRTFAVDPQSSSREEEAPAWPDAPSRP